MLPRCEVKHLTRTIAEAVDLADLGDAGQGYTCLLVGLCYAKEMQAAGEPWGEELVLRWRQVCERYAAHHQIGWA